MFIPGVDGPRIPIEMTDIQLAPEHGGEPIDIPKEKTTIGRGPLMKVFIVYHVYGSDIDIYNGIIWFSCHYATSHVCVCRQFIVLTII